MVFARRTPEECSAYGGASPGKSVSRSWEACSDLASIGVLADAIGKAPVGRKQMKIPNLMLFEKEQHGLCRRCLVELP